MDTILGDAFIVVLWLMGIEIMGEALIEFYRLGAQIFRKGIR